MHFTQDIHVHTNLSLCAQPEATPQNYFALCEKQGISTIGFSNHYWDERMPGASDWYAQQDTAHILQIREQLSQTRTGTSVRVLVGCETEYCGHGKIGISREMAKQLDFVLVPTDHYHMIGFTVSKKLDDPREIRLLLMEHFLDVVEMDIATGIAHPFLPLGVDCKQQVLETMTDADYVRCFSRAAEKNVSIELNYDLYQPALCKDANGFPIEYMRLVRIAKDCGCKFHCGSDAHKPSSFLIHRQIDAFASACGLTDADALVL